MLHIAEFEIKYLFIVSYGTNRKLRCNVAATFLTSILIMLVVIILLFGVEVLLKQ